MASISGSGHQDPVVKSRGKDQRSLQEDCSAVCISMIMSTDVITLAEDDPIEMIIEVFDQYYYHTYPVVRADNELVGIIDQNIILQVLLVSRMPRVHHTHLMAVRSIGEDARGVMIPHPVTISSDTNLCDAAELMIKHRIDRFCVVDDGKLVGMISKRDIIKEICRIRSID
ncbi:MAG: CBS domain-containing protein [Euryarchaeota archaeon]|nr:CBS domain-containing protein [Euryarchaeota archaeon]